MIVMKCSYQISGHFLLSMVKCVTLLGHILIRSVPILESRNLTQAKFKLLLLNNTFHMDEGLYGHSMRVKIIFFIDALPDYTLMGFHFFQIYEKK